MATSLIMLIGARVLQGLAGGGLQPSSQGVLLDAFPPERQGTAMTVFGMAALLAPVVGPTLGGYITDNYNWRWIFYLNVPVGLLALFMCSRLVVDPDYLVAQRDAARRQRQPFDLLGLVLLAVTMVCWEVMLSKGQEWDWLGDPFLRVQTLLVLFLVSLVTLIVRQLRIANPLINFRTLKDRNFRSCCIIIFCAYGVLYANTTTLPALLQSLFGYDATTSGLVLSPSGVASLMVLFVVGIPLGRGLDARYLMAAGVLTLAAGNLWLSRLNLDIGPWQVVWPRVVVISGLSMLFAPLNLAAFLYIPPRLRGAAVGLLALLRNEGGSVGTSMAQTMVERREQFHVLRLNEKLDALYPAVQRWLEQGRGLFMHGTGDPVRSQQMALRSLRSCATGRPRRWHTSTCSGPRRSWRTHGLPRPPDASLGGGEGCTHRPRSDRADPGGTTLGSVVARSGDLVHLPPVLVHAVHDREHERRRPADQDETREALDPG